MKRSCAVLLIILSLTIWNAAFSERSSGDNQVNWAMGKGAEELLSKQCIKLLKAKQILQDNYGITPAMYTFFESNYFTTSDGDLIFILSGRDSLKSVLGVYNVQIGTLGTTVEWSHGNVNISDDFTSHAWGCKQLNSMLYTAISARNLSSIMSTAAILTNADDGYIDMTYCSHVEYINVRKDEIPVPINCSENEMLSTAQRAVQSLLGHQLNEVALVTAEDEELVTNYFQCGSTYLFRVTLYLEQESYDNWTLNDGAYTIWINVGDGKIENIEYDSMLFGAG